MGTYKEKYYYGKVLCLCIDQSVVNQSCFFSLFRFLLCLRDVLLLEFLLFLPLSFLCRCRLLRFLSLLFSLWVNLPRLGEVLSWISALLEGLPRRPEIPEDVAEDI